MIFGEEIARMYWSILDNKRIELLRKIGCDNVQGYYYAKPMPVEDFFELLQKDRQSINSL